jgi:transposase InsO family protein
MIRLFKPALEGFHWVYVIIDKFSKWIEYKPLVSRTVKKAAELLDQTIHRFGLPNSIITDLGSTFTGNNFLNFAMIEALFSSTFRCHTQGLTGRLSELTV